MQFLWSELFLDKSRLLLCFYGLCVCASSLAQKDSISPARCFISECDIYHIGASRFKSYHGNFYSTHLPFTLLTSGVINRRVLYISHMRALARTRRRLSFFAVKLASFSGTVILTAQTLKNDSFYFVGFLSC